MGKRHSASKIDIYSNIVSKRVTFIIVGLIILGISIPLTSSIGPATTISVQDVANAIIAKIFPFTGVQSTELADYIVWEIRLPRVIMALVAGMGFAVSGAAMQGSLRNPLVSPFTLGISSAAGFGAALAIVMGAGIASNISIGEEALIVSNAFIFGLIATGIVFLLARIRGISPETIILSGIAVMFFFGALTSLLQYFASDDQLRDVVFWLMGNLARSDWSDILIVAIITIGCLPLLLRYSWDINALSAGDESAHALGTNVKKVRVICMVLSTLITAAIVSFCGIIGFVCLVSPHITRMIIGADHRFLIPASGITGAILLLLADTLARNVIQPTEIPIGIVTSLIGVPFFTYLLLTKKREYF